MNNLNSMLSSEQAAIQSIANEHGYLNRCMTHSIDYSQKLIAKYINSNSRVLEVGPAEGRLSTFLYESAGTYEVVEPSELFAANLKNRYPNASVNCCMIEDFHATAKYDFILLSHVLEHVIDPVNVLCHCKQYMSENTILFCIVPNSHSLHRQAAVKMGILREESQLNKSDIKHGHKRVYNLTKLSNDFISAGLDIVSSGGYWLKPLSNSQLESSWSDKMFEAFMELGESYPEICAEIYLASALA